jgi:hypothetical protein
MVEKMFFDIETAGKDFESLDAKTQEYLLRFAKDEEAVEKEKASMGLWPLTGEIIAISLYSSDQKKGIVYYRNERPDNTKNDILLEGEWSFAPVKDEKELLKKFWAAVKQTKQIISFNGRVFDAPFILVRSAVNKLKPTINLMPTRYNEFHLDLMEQLTFYGAVKRRFSLEMWCKTLGIENPKKDVEGTMVTGLFKEQKYFEIAKYCKGDTVATFSLYTIWKEFMNKEA